jgi:hypothetical protein
MTYNTTPKWVDGWIIEARQINVQITLMTNELLANYLCFDITDLQLVQGRSLGMSPSPAIIMPPNDFFGAPWAGMLRKSGETVMIRGGPGAHPDSLAVEQFLLAEQGMRLRAKPPRG